MLPEEEEGEGEVDLPPEDVAEVAIQGAMEDRDDLTGRT
jgi:hypothetical protein